jgi:geranylgeranyl reductase family protein
MKIAIVGAGPAGAHLATLLSKNGCEVLLFDARATPWEKPCGGGVTTKALREFAFLSGNNAEKQLVSTVRVVSVSGREVAVQPRADFAIYARAELDRMMRAQALAAGVTFLCARIARIARNDEQWELKTQTGEVYTCDFLVGADGATSKLRPKFGVEFKPRDFIYGLGWHIKTKNPGDWEAARVDIKYLKNCAGYIWAFPRPDHISYGIATKYQEKPPQYLKAELLNFIATQLPAVAQEIKSSAHHSTPHATFYGAMIPSLTVETWDQLKVSDAQQSWALVGDAAGFVDPITGEGIYYAIKSAQLLAHAILTRPEDYEAMWRSAFGAELRRAAEMLPRFYYGKFLGQPFTERVIQFARHHRGVRDTLNDLIAGEQEYLGLKRRLCKSLLTI